ncbi:AraC family transcriptional regulator [Euzebya tangerina]|uniref:AraC family transcriptional regulator n=1 Tax=Euzebya tangerina TaxID=591198 RepID=UPI000E32265A|nr:AraC family transcriptional regulator [Euzebya tangerina]
MTELARQIQAAVDFIEAHLHTNLDLREVSRAAAMGHSTFQRSFRAVTGETVKAYVRARRLSHALDLLESTDLRILDIAFAAGYETQESFARAFKSVMGMTPSAFRHGHRAREVLRRPPINLAYLSHVTSDEISTVPTIQDRPAMTVVGQATRYDLGDRQRNTLGVSLADLWAGFVARAEEVAGADTGTMIGLISDEEHSGEGLEYVAGVDAPLASTPAGMVRRQVPAGRWAVFDHRGLPTDLDHTIDYIYGSWLPRTDERHSSGPDLEIYGPAYLPDSAASVIRYAVPLR